MKASATHIDRAALRIRAQLITARTSMANQLRGLLKLFGLRLIPASLIPVSHAPDDLASFVEG